MLGQKIAGESAELIARSFNRPSRKPLDLSIKSREVVTIVAALLRLAVGGKAAMLQR